VLQVDSPVPEHVLQKLQDLDAIMTIRFVKLA
jgi:hypothetical protein